MELLNGVGEHVPYHTGGCVTPEEEAGDDVSVIGLQQ